MILSIPTLNLFVRTRPRDDILLEDFRPLSLLDSSDLEDLGLKEVIKQATRQFEEKGRDANAIDESLDQSKRRRKESRELGAGREKRTAFIHLYESKR